VEADTPTPPEPDAGAVAGGDAGAGVVVRGGRDAGALVAGVVAAVGGVEVAVEWSPNAV